MSNILTAFNDHFVDFIIDVQSVFPEDPDILTAKNSLPSLALLCTPSTPRRPLCSASK